MNQFPFTYEKALRDIQCQDINRVQYGLVCFEKALMQTTAPLSKLNYYMAMARAQHALSQPTATEASLKAGIALGMALTDNADTLEPDEIQYLLCQLRLFHAQLIMTGFLPFCSFNEPLALFLAIYQTYTTQLENQKFKHLGLEAMLGLCDLGYTTVDVTKPTHWLSKVLVRTIKSPDLIELHIRTKIKFGFIGRQYGYRDADFLTSAYQLSRQHQLNQTMIDSLLGFGHNHIIFGDKLSKSYPLCYRDAYKKALQLGDAIRQVQALIGLGLYAVYTTEGQAYLQEAYHGAKMLHDKSLMVMALLGLAQHSSNTGSKSYLEEAQQAEPLILNPYIRDLLYLRLGEAQFPPPTSGYSWLQRASLAHHPWIHIVAFYRLEVQPLSDSTLFSYYNKAKAVDHMDFISELTAALAKRDSIYPQGKAYPYWQKKIIHMRRRLPKDCPFLIEAKASLSNDRSKSISNISPTSSISSLSR